MNERLEEYDIGGLLNVLCRDDMIHGLVGEIKNILDEENNEDFGCDEIREYLDTKEDLKAQILEECEE